MEAFTKHTGIISVLNRGNIDTDQIISKEFLKSIKRTGFGDSLFNEWRYSDDGKENPDFELNDPAYKGTSILVTGNNFGCGSSREHAVWAVVQYGYKTIIAPRKEIAGDMIPGFADIFRNNSGKNGLLLIELDDDKVQNIIKTIESQKGIQATNNLEDQTIVLHAKEGDQEYPFDVDSELKEKLLKGLDDIGQTELSLDAIKTFEQTHDTQLPQT